MYRYIAAHGNVGGGGRVNFRSGQDSGVLGLVRKMRGQVLVLVRIVGNGEGQVFRTYQQNKIYFGFNFASMLKKKPFSKHNAPLSYARIIHWIRFLRPFPHLTTYDIDSKQIIIKKLNRADKI